MKTVLILHGITGTSQENWFPWLKTELEKEKYHVICPDLPKTEHPNRQEWFMTISELLKDVDHSQLTIVGHSLGIPSALDYIEQSQKPIHSLVSAAGFSDDYKHPLNSYFLAEKEIDFTKVNKNLDQAYVLYGDDDPYVPQESLQLLADNLNVTPQIFSGGGHLNASAGFIEFPEILAAILDNS